MTKSKWQEVAQRAEVEEDEEIDVRIVEALDDHRVGLPSSSAWMARYKSSQEDVLEVTMSPEEIGCSYGYEDDVAYFELPETRTCVWVPTDKHDCAQIARDLRNIDPSIYSKEWIADGITRHLDKPFNTVFAVRDAESRKTEGVFVYRRYLDLYENSATVNYHIHAFHCEGDISQRAALLAAFHKQCVVDFECAIISLAEAGLTPQLFSEIHVEDDDDGMYSRYHEIMELARDDMFEHTKVPDNVDLEAFGPWILGVVDPSRSETHQVFRP